MQKLVKKKGVLERIAFLIVHRPLFLLSDDAKLFKERWELTVLQSQEVRPVRHSSCQPGRFADVHFDGRAADSFPPAREFITSVMPKLDDDFSAGSRVLHVDEERGFVRHNTVGLKTPRSRCDDSCF